MVTKPAQVTLDVHEFKRRMCEYMRRLQAGECDLIIRRYRKPVAIVLSTYQTGLRNKARVAQDALNAVLAAQKRFATQRRRILINAALHWPNTKFAYLRSGGGNGGGDRAR